MAESSSSAPTGSEHTIKLLVLAANGLVKRDIFSLPNPFAVITTDGADIRQTAIVKKTLTPYWNEPFDLLRHPISAFLLSVS
ncbi:E3 ubiquitin-protein ligase NEDD4 [Lactarius quietus]|nr:E3 ubiquitin-protein ligase NEDD4 [Lactarius quietus]